MTIWRRGWDPNPRTDIVVSNASVNLFGRDLFRAFNFYIVHNPAVLSAYKLTSDILHDFSDYFSDDFKANVNEFVKLEVPADTCPVYCKARKVPIRIKDALKKELDRLMASGIISKVHSSDWAIPIVTVYKKSGDIRLCADFSTTLSKFMKPVNCVLPTIDQVIASVGQTTVFSKIDLAQAFLQLPIHPDSRKYLVINTPEGLFQFNYLPFGLTASPGKFQSYMCKILDNIPGVIIYQDDLLLMSPDCETHNKLLKTVLTKLKKAGLRLNFDKCTFFTDKVDYLGYVFDANGVHPNPNKLTAILEAPVPSNTKQVQSFVGLANFYSRFIPNFAHYMSPLYALLQKNAKFSWTSEHQQAFDRINQLFLDKNILCDFNTSFETSIETDSSSYGVGCVLLQRPHKNACWSPVQFASRTLNSAECNYSQIEREALSVMFALDKFREFLLGSHFTLYNDHKPLFTLFAKHKPVPVSCSGRVQRWALKLSQFGYEFVYSKGSDNVHSGFLSRLPLPVTCDEVEPYELVFVINSLDTSPISHDAIREHTQRDQNLTQLMSFIKHGCPDKIKNEALSKYKANIEHMTIMKGCIMFHNRVLIPPSLQSDVLKLFHENHPGIVAMKSLARSLIWFPGLDRDIEHLVKSCKVCQSNRRSRPPQKVHVAWPTPSRPWQRLHIDHFFYEDKVCLLVIDALSKYIEVEIVKNVTVQETIDTLIVIFSRHGLPDVICSDNATCFTSSYFSSFLSSFGIEHITSPPYSPSSNGQAERGVRVIKDLLKKQQSTESLRNRLARVLFYYGCVPHNVTQIAPSVALN